MIEKAFLPVRFVNSKLEQFLADNVAQRLNPSGQSNSMPRESGKEINVIGHNNITTNGDIMLPGLYRKNAKRVVNFITCEKALAFVHVERDEVERANIVKQTGESGRMPRPSFRIRTWHSSFLWIVAPEVNSCNHGGAQVVATALCRRVLRQGHCDSASTQRGDYKCSGSFSP